MTRKVQLWVTGAAALLSGAFSAPGFAQQYTEVKAASTLFADIEFDSARDGLNCGSCNFGQGNARFNWTDKLGNLWIGHVDWQTGKFTPSNGEAELADTNAAYWKDFGNGPEWAFSQAGSQLVYARYIPGMPRTPANVGAALASMVNGVWTAGFLPGSLGSTDGGPANSVLPEASQAPSDPVALVLYKNVAKPQQVFWEQASLDGSAAPFLTPFGGYSNGINERWVPQTNQVLFIGSAFDIPTMKTYQQVFWFDTDTDTVVQLTTDPTNKNDMFMFQAPEFNDAYAFITVANGTVIQVYEQTGETAAGAPTFGLVSQITSTDPAEPLIASAEPFVNCTPACSTHVFMTLTAATKAGGGNANGLAVSNIDPAHPQFTVLATAASGFQRTDPEYFISASGPLLYYGRYTAATPTAPEKYQGEYFINMQLGAPVGPCVGSSAEGGMLPGC